MDFEQISRSLLPLLGGKENIVNVENCISRLRVDLKDRSPISRRLAKSTG